MREYKSGNHNAEPEIRAVILELAESIKLHNQALATNNSNLNTFSLGCMSALRTLAETLHTQILYVYDKKLITRIIIRGGWQQEDEYMDITEE